MRDKGSGFLGRWMTRAASLFAVYCCVSTAILFAQMGMGEVAASPFHLWCASVTYAILGYLSLSHALEAE